MQCPEFSDLHPPPLFRPVAANEVRFETSAVERGLDLLPGHPLGHGAHQSPQGDAGKEHLLQVFTSLQFHGHSSLEFGVSQLGACVDGDPYLLPVLDEEQPDEVLRALGFRRFDGEVFFMDTDGTKMKAYSLGKAIRKFMSLGREESKEGRHAWKLGKGPFCVCT